MTRRVTIHRLFPEGLPEGCSITVHDTLDDDTLARQRSRRAAYAYLPPEAEAQGRSVCPWLQAEDPLCHGCQGTGFGEDTDFAETCVHCNGEGIEINRPNQSQEA